MTRRVELLNRRLTRRSIVTLVRQAVDWDATLLRPNSDPLLVPEFARSTINSLTRISQIIRVNLFRSMANMSFLIRLALVTMVSYCIGF